MPSVSVLIQNSGLGHYLGVCKTKQGRLEKIGNLVLDNGLGSQQGDRVHVLDPLLKDSCSMRLSKNEQEHFIYHSKPTRVLSLPRSLILSLSLRLWEGERVNREHVQTPTQQICCYPYLNHVRSIKSSHAYSFQLQMKM